MKSDLASLRVSDGFRLRGESVSRLETFVDAAFAFALTLMVISAGGVPGSAGELMLALHRVPTFAVCFAILAIFWIAHERWSRRYGLENGATTFWSLALVFVTLVWIYPLRMVMSAALAWMSGGWVPQEMSPQTGADLQDCFLVYGLGFGASSAIMLQLQRIAHAHATELELDLLERLETRRDMISQAILLAAALCSVVLTFFLRGSEGWLGGLPGMVYWLIGPAMFVHHSRAQKLRARLAPRAS